MGKNRKKIYSVILAVLLLVFGSTVPEGRVEVQAAEGTGQNPGMGVHFLDVGQGLSVLVQSGGQNLLYDGGDRSASSFVVSYLQDQEISSIDYLIASHYDEDHISGLIGCLNAFDVKNVIGPDYEHDSALYSSFISAVDTRGLSVQTPSVGDVCSLGTGSFTVLSPSDTEETDSNRNSIVIRITNGDDSFLLTGDAEHENEADMIASGLELESSVLCVGHHGSASSTSWDFLQNTVPEYAVISCGIGNSYGHPDADTMQKLADMEIPVYRTDKQGTIVAYSDGNTITWNQAPCNDYTPGNENDYGTQAVSGTAFGSGAGAAAKGASEGEGEQEELVWLSATGSKYHSIPDCGNMNPAKAVQVPLSQAETQGFEPCSKCW